MLRGKAEKAELFGLMCSEDRVELNPFLLLIKKGYCY